MMAHPPLSAHDGPSPDPLRTPLDAAQVMTARGWVVFPCDHPDAGLRCTGAHRPGYVCDDPHKRGKHPRVKWGEITTPTDSATLRAWFGDDARPANVAVACGPSGLLVVDEDRDGALSAYAASIGEEVPATFRVATSRGWHWYFEVLTGPDGTRVPVGNAPGALAGWGCDVRGGASVSAPHGGYVIGPGSVHWSGVVYTADQPYAPVALAPGWLVAAVLAPVAPLGPPGPAEGSVPDRAGQPGNAGTTTGTRYDDDPRYGSPLDLHAQFQRHCDEVTHDGGLFRWELFLAARDGWRLVALGLLDEDTMQSELAGCVRRVWDAEPDDRDTVIVMEEAAAAAERSPWQVSGGPVDDRPLPSGSTFTTPGRARLTSADAPADRTTAGNRAVTEDRDSTQPEEAARYARKLATKIEDERLRRDAREALDAAGRPELLIVTPKGRKDRPRASYLVPKMIYRNGLAVLFGASKTGKTFFALDIALSLAAGKPWRGVRLTNATGGPGMVHYLMAEGEDANNLRMDAWLYHHDLTDDDIEDHFRTIPAAVMLTEAGIRPYLPYVENDKPDLIVLDTKNLMFAGKEAAGEDYGVMLRALHRLQDAAGGCAIILIDHVGLGDGTRPRGNGAEEAGVDTAILVTNDHGLRTAEVTKDRSAELGTRWHYRLSQMPEVARDPFMDAPAVVIEADPDSGPLRPRIDWPMLCVSDDLQAMYRRVPEGKGKEAAADVLRLLAGLGRDEEGQTTAKIVGLITKECPRVFADSTIRGAVATLRRSGVIESIGTGAAPKYVIVDEWRSHVTEE